MGRRASNSKKREMADTPKATNVAFEIEEARSEGSNPSAVQPEKASPLLEKTNSKVRVQEKSVKASTSKKKPKLCNAGVRRSLRILNCVRPVQDRSVQPVIEQIDVISDSEKEDEQLLLEEPLNGPTAEEPLNGSTFEGKNMEDKVDYALRLLKKLNLKLKKGSSGIPDLSYKSLYIDSQKKIEALKDENRELSMKLEVALAKLEGFEKGTGAFFEVMEKMKDVILASTLSRATENVGNVSSQPVCDALSPPNTVQTPRSAAKRKRQS